MPSVFEDYDFDKAQKLVLDLEDDAKASSLAYQNGDHYQNGTEWKGPPDLDVPNRSLILSNSIKPILISKNIVKEVVQANTDAVIGREPNWGFSDGGELNKLFNRRAKKAKQPEDATQSAPEQDQRIVDLEAMLVPWWDTKGILETLQDATDLMNAAGDVVLRWVVPKGFVSEDGTVLPGDFTTWLNRLNLSVAKYDEATVFTDEDTQEKASFFASERDGVKRIELSYLDDDGNTIVRILEDKKEPQEGKPRVLGGKLIAFQMHRDPLITTQVKQNQALFNTTLTMRCRNIGVAGFPMTDFLNADPPSDFIDNPEAPGSQIKIAANQKRGAGITNYAAPIIVMGKDGAPLVDNTGKPTVIPANVRYRDPVSVKTFEDTERAAYRNILEETRQLHRMMGGDATASGVSRIQARGDFLSSLRPTKTQVDAAGRWVLETALALAASFAGTANPYADLRATFDCRIDSGPLAPEERAAIINEVSNEPPLRSVEDAMTLLGIDDPDAMLAQIESERQRLNPRAGIDLERARLSLENDKRNGDGGIPSRIEEAAKEKESLVN